jgi:hypothetical protein
VLKKQRPLRVGYANQIFRVEFLQAMAKSYQLPDIGKAVRCLIDYARENPDKQAEIFGEVHCQDC